MEGYLGVVLIVLVLIFIMLVVFWINSYHTYWTKRGVDALPTVPLIGNTQNVWLLKESLGVNLKKTYDHFKAKGKRYAGYYLLLKPVFVPIDLDLIKTIVIEDFNHFTDHIGRIDEKGDPMSAHLFNQKGDRWKFLRPKLSAMFTSGKLKGMFDGMLSYSKQFADLVGKKADGDEAIDIEHITLRCTADILVSSLFGIKSRILMGGEVEFEMCIKKLFGSNFKDAICKLLLFTYPELFVALKMRTFDKQLTEFFMNFVKQHLEQRSTSKLKRKDFVQLLLECGSNEGDERPLSLEEIGAQYLLYFLGGVETVAMTVYFTLFELALNQDIQEKARNEIKTIRNNFCYESTLGLSYLSNCIAETLRKYAPASLATRVCTKEYTIANTDVTIEKGTYVMIPIHAIHMDPEYFPSPCTYDPDRFSKDSENYRDSFAFMPVGFGPRMCIGQRFGMMEASVILSVLLSQFRFSIHPKTKLPLQYAAWAITPVPLPSIMLTAERVDKR
ncbi:probable cytochrome P450 6a13 [Photinus pyralis]|uniref:probable cytochrome P450 6a13 n=1 Tax=Photinus pyralis TaxID=7054 RepID=UPI0012674025|nr:probable cytochrome P450 6a13 [Photinus pyralis]